MTDWSPPRTPRVQISRVPHLPGLDGMRALAVVAVMIYHANHNWLHGGFLGVEVFFVISGYLITLLLIAEHERTGGVDLKQFWLRRARRLLPALFVMLALLMVYLALFKSVARGRVRGDIIGGSATSATGTRSGWAPAYTASEDFAPLRHLWSLAVEEQFYLVWPLVMVAILRRGGRPAAAVALWLFGVSLFDHGGDGAAVRVGRHQLDLQPGRTPTATGSSPAAASASTTRCTSARSHVPGADARRRVRDGVASDGDHARPDARRGRQLDVLAVVVAASPACGWCTSPIRRSTILTGSRFDSVAVPRRHLPHRVFTLFVIAAVTHQRSMLGHAARQPSVLTGSAPAATGCTCTTGRSTRSSAGGRQDAERCGSSCSRWVSPSLITEASYPLRRDADAQGCDRRVVARRAPPTVPSRPSRDAGSSPDSGSSR
jgi:hypothetical protein